MSVNRNGKGQFTKSAVKIGTKVICLQNMLGVTSLKPYTVVATKRSKPDNRKSFHKVQYLDENEFIFVDNDGDRVVGRLGKNQFNHVWEVLCENN